MAISTSTFNLTGDVQAHLKERLTDSKIRSEILKPAEEIVTFRVKEFSRNEKQITGQQMPALSRTYSNLKKDLAGSSRADLRFGYNEEGGRKARAMDSMYTQTTRNGNKHVIGYGFNPAANAPDKSADEYMLDLQRGDYAPGGDKRKWFPENKDSRTPGVQAITRDVEQIISTHLRFGKTLVRNITLG